MTAYDTVKTLKDKITLLEKIKWRGSSHNASWLKLQRSEGDYDDDKFCLIDYINSRNI